MARVQRPSIPADVRAKPVDLGKPFSGIMTAFAKAHEGAEPEFVDVAAMRLDMIADRCRLEDAALEAELAKRLLEQLVPPNSGPTRR
jgi:hypothetical protein